MDRRVVLAGLGALAVAGTGGYALRVQAAGRYAEAAATARAPLNLAAAGPDLLAELVRMASLAPNSHNTQGWRFTGLPDGVRAEVDPARRTPVVDPDDHHLFVSLGAAVETLILAATAYGIGAVPTVTPDGTVTLRFADGASPSPLLPAILQRQSHRGLYDGTALTDADRATLLAADPGLTLIEDWPTRSALADLTADAYRAQLEDAAYRAELLAWLRFSRPAALDSLDGLFAGCSGSPALPQGLGAALFPVIVTARSQGAALAAQMASSSALVLLVTAPDTPAARIETGRRLQRLGLAAAQAGLAVAHVNPALENPQGRAEVARLCAVAAGRPSILLRVGRAHSPMPMSLRRLPQQTLVIRR